MISSIKSIFNYFSGGNEDIRKISWIDWDTICSKKENDGLKVQQLREFNMTLHGKWCWRLKEKHCCLWYKAQSAQ